MQTQLKTYATDECVATAEAVKVYNFRIGEHGQLLDLIDEDIGDDIDAILDAAGFGLSGEDEEASTPSEQINRLALQYQYEHPGVAFPDAVQRVMSNDKELALAYSGECDGRPARTYSQSNRDDPSTTIHELALVHMDETDEEDYAKAVEHVLKTDPRLNRAYGEYVSEGSS